MPCNNGQASDEAGSGHRMADHRPRGGGRIVLDAVQGIARPLLCEPARGVHLDLAGALGDGLRFDRARLFGARLVRPDRASSAWPEDRLAVRRAHLLRHLRHRPQHRRLGFLRRGHPLPRLFDPGPQRGGGRALGRLLLLHLRPRRRHARRPAAHVLRPDLDRTVRGRAGLGRTDGRRWSCSPRRASTGSARSCISRRSGSPDSP